MGVYPIELPATAGAPAQQLSSQDFVWIMAERHGKREWAIERWRETCMASGQLQWKTSDVSEAIKIKILPPWLFVWGGHGWLWRKKFRAVINTPKWLLLDARQGQGWWAGAVSPSMLHRLVGWHVSIGAGNRESASITCSLVFRGPVRIRLPDALHPLALAHKHLWAHSNANQTLKKDMKCHKNVISPPMSPAHSALPPAFLSTQHALICMCVCVNDRVWDKLVVFSLWVPRFCREQQGGSYNPITVVVTRAHRVPPGGATFLASSNSPSLWSQQLWSQKPDCH